MTQPNKKTLLILIAITILMFGFGFAMVPLYDVFCKVTGLNGKTNATGVANNSAIDTSRTVTIEFVTTNNENLPWDFYAKTNKITMHPGENKRIEFYAKNLTNKTMVGQAIPSVTPLLAAKYLLKTECFCFNQQTLKPGEPIDMPVIFHVDPDLPRDIKTITLSYTMFNATNLKQRPNITPGKLNA